MKNALYLLLLVCSFGHAQRLIVTADGLKNSTDPAKSYVVIEADSLNSKQLYTKAMNYIQKNYTNPDLVIKGNIANEYLKIVTHATNFITIKNSFAKTPFSVDYTFELSFKDGKVKYEVVTIDMYNDAGYKLTFTGTGGLSGFSVYNKKGELKRTDAKDSIESYFNAQVTAIANSLKENISKEKW